MNNTNTSNTEKKNTEAQTSKAYPHVGPSYMQKGARGWIMRFMPLLLLAVPLVAMWFTDEVNWDLTDIVVMGALLMSAGLALEIVVKKVGMKYRLVASIAIVIAFLLIWAELAVGLFGMPFAGD